MTTTYRQIIIISKNDTIHTNIQIKKGLQQVKISQKVFFGGGDNFLTHTVDLQNNN